MMIKPLKIQSSIPMLELISVIRLSTLGGRDSADSCGSVIVMESSKWGVMGKCVAWDNGGGRHLDGATSQASEGKMVRWWLQIMVAEMGRMVYRGKR